MENISKGYEYSTQKRQILFKEYGRNVQMLAEYVQNIEDKEERTKKAHTLVELMRNINPSLKDTVEYYQKIWDHLFLITGLELDVEAPYPKPEESVIMRGAPKNVDYNTHDLSFRHYGRNVELLISSAMAKETPQEQFDAMVYIGRLMKKFYAAWNGENIDNAVIAGHIKRLSGGKLIVDLEKIAEKNLWDVQAVSSGSSPRYQQKRHSSGGRRNDSRGGGKSNNGRNAGGRPNNKRNNNNRKSN